MVYVEVLCDVEELVCVGYCVLCGVKVCDVDFGVGVFGCFCCGGCDFEVWFL